MYGGEEVPKDVLEYVVFERYLVNPYGTWRMHGKIVPEWAPPKDPIVKVKKAPVWPVAVKCGSPVNSEQKQS